MPDEITCPLPTSMSVVVLATDTPQMQGSRLGWRTDIVDVMASGGRFTVTACSLRLLVRVTDTFESRPVADSRSARVMIPAGLFEDTFERARQAGAARVDVQFGSSGTRLCFPAGGQRISVPVPQVVGSPPPTDELLRASQSSVRREPVFEVPPRLTGEAAQDREGRLSRSAVGVIAVGPRPSAMGGPERFEVAGGCHADPAHRLRRYRVRFMQHNAVSPWRSVAEFRAEIA
jgi:hypothetical protein